MEVIKKRPKLRYQRKYIPLIKGTLEENAIIADISEE